MAHLRVSGVGMAVVNADRVKIVENLIKDNRPVPDVDLNFPAAGLDILTVPSPTGGPDPGPATKVSVISNRFVNNTPLDILVGQPLDTLTFKRNSCKASNPAAICHRRRPSQSSSNALLNRGGRCCLVCSAKYRTVRPDKIRRADPSSD